VSSESEWLCGRSRSLDDGSRARAQPSSDRPIWGATLGAEVATDSSRRPNTLIADRGNTQRQIPAHRLRNETSPAPQWSASWSLVASPEHPVSCSHLGRAGSRSKSWDQRVGPLPLVEEQVGHRHHLLLHPHLVGGWHMPPALHPDVTRDSPKNGRNVDKRSSGAFDRHRCRRITQGSLTGYRRVVVPMTAFRACGSHRSKSDGVARWD
jgi:hypothetical protein